MVEQRQHRDLFDDQVSHALDLIKLLLEAESRVLVEHNVAFELVWFHVPFQLVSVAAEEHA